MSVYNSVTVTACEGGWLIKQKGRPDKVVVRWELVLLTLREELTSYGDEQAQKRKAEGGLT